MKTITGFGLGLAAALSVPSVLADGSDTKAKAKVETGATTTATDATVSEPVPPSTDTSGTTTNTPSSLETAETAGTAADATGGGPPASEGAAAPATASTTTTSDYYVREEPAAPGRVRVRSGVGVNVYGTAGTKDSARLGLGGRVEFVMPFGLTLGGSYTVHATSDFERTGVRPLHGEVGWAIPVVNHLEVRPMVGLGYAFATVTTDTDSNQPVTANQTVQASGMAFAGGFDFAPGAKLSYVARGFEIFTLPKYHFITDNNFLGVEVGAGARF